MNFILTEEQNMLADTARRFVDEHVSLERFRRRRGEPAHSPELWNQMVDMGWTALIVPEEFDGLGLGMTEFVLVLETLGRNLATEPLWSSALLGGAAIAAAGTLEQRAEWLPGVADGSRVVALAYAERDTRYDLRRCRCEAVRDGDGWRLTGSKAHVLDASAATNVLVMARTSGASNAADGRTLFLVPASELGIAPQRRVDERDAATITLDGVHVSTSQIIGAVGGAGEVLDAILDRALVGIAAEMLGAATRALELSLAYLREREQFGAPLGSFQALQHRAAKVFIQVEMARSAVMLAARAIDANQDDAPAMASLAKAKAGQALELAANEGIQFHGGVGMTDEYDIGFFLKRHRGADTTLGDAAWHRRRWATLQGY